MRLRSIQSTSYTILLALTLLSCITILSSNAQLDAAEQLLRPEDFEDLGAFLVPIGEQSGSSFAYGGSSLAWRPDGDPYPPQILLCNPADLAVRDHFLFQAAFFK